MKCIFLFWGDKTRAVLTCLWKSLFLKSVSTERCAPCDFVFHISPQGMQVSVVLYLVLHHFQLLQTKKNRDLNVTPSFAIPIRQ